ncbi:Intraflagellar transport protein 46 [Pleodorina starrii]|nr:Intraflagellar transport protein 46 [Pleodorina starrii]
MDDSFYREDDGFSGELGEGEQFQGTARSTVVQNQPHDEEVNLSESESFAGADEPPAVPRDASLIESHDMDEGPAAPARTISPEAYDASAKHGGGMPAGGGSGGGGGGGDDSTPAGAYNAQEYKHLNVPDDVRELFQYIGRYKPQTVELETKLKPFIPDYIPAVGGIDEFIKVPRPDGKPDYLGLKVLDEPAAKQSDPTVLTLQLRQLSKEAPGAKSDMVGRLEHADENKAKKIQQWIGSILDIHKAKPPASVSYSKRMPEIEALMQEWPPEVEGFLKSMKMPTGDVELDIKTYAKLVCTLLDIPVYDDPIESLHVLFTLYLEFKNNPIFRQHMEMENKLDGMATVGGPGAADVLGL